MYILHGRALVEVSLAFEMPAAFAVQVRININGFVLMQCIGRWLGTPLRDSVLSLEAYLVEQLEWVVQLPRRLLWARRTAEDDSGTHI